MKKIMVCIFVCLFLINFIPTASSSESSSPLGYGPWKVYGLFPSVSEDGITCFLIGPFLGVTVLNRSRFNGHIGIFFIFGEYQWFEDGPPALP